MHSPGWNKAVLGIQGPALSGPANETETPLSPSVLGDLCGQSPQSEQPLPSAAANYSDMGMNGSATRICRFLGPAHPSPSPAALGQARESASCTWRSTILKSSPSHLTPLAQQMLERHTHTET